MQVERRVHILDPLYGRIELDGDLAELAKTPAVQRLRRVRLSNIDSFDNPGIAQTSRFEHVVGTCHLSSRVKAAESWSGRDRLVLQAAALLHDWGIAAYGHLVEEAMMYMGESVTHESKLAVLDSDPNVDELGGIDLQLYLGQQAGLRDWAQSTFGPEWRIALDDIKQALVGRGRFGRFVSSDIDVDNLDNVTRVAHHMGLDCDRTLPDRIAREMIATSHTCSVIYSSEGISLVSQWLDLRRSVYRRLMLSRQDFAAKGMVIYAVARSLQELDMPSTGQLWRLTDDELLQALLQSRQKDVHDTVLDWQSGKLWPVSNLTWMTGRKRPNVTELWKLSRELTSELLRPCLCYAINDKRTRHLELTSESGDTVSIGDEPSRWLFGMVSRGDPLTRNQNRMVLEAAQAAYHCKAIETAEDPSCADEDSQVSLSLFS